MERSSVQSWYGEPQYEESSGSEWEPAYYGGSSEGEPTDALEFVPGIEHPGAFDGSGNTSPSSRVERALSAGD